MPVRVPGGKGLDGHLRGFRRRRVRRGLRRGRGGFRAHRVFAKGAVLLPWGNCGERCVSAQALQTFVDERPLEPRPPLVGRDIKARIQFENTRWPRCEAIKIRKHQTQTQCWSSSLFIPSHVPVRHGAARLRGWKAQVRDRRRFFQWSGTQGRGAGPRVCQQRPPLAGPETPA